MSLALSERRARLALRAAAVVATFQAVAHAALFTEALPAPGSLVWPLVQAMQAQSAPGRTNYWAMYLGYGLLAAVTAFLVAALIWVISGFDSGGRRLARSLTAVVLAGVVAHAALIARYFFPVPLYFDCVVAVLLAVAWIQLAAARSGSDVTR